MEGRNIPPFITLTAAMIACVICIFRKASLFSTLKIVLIVMILFYIIGRIVQKILVKIDHDAEEAALQRQREEQEKAARELEESELNEQNKNADSEKKINGAEQNAENGTSLN